MRVGVSFESRVYIGTSFVYHLGKTRELDFGGTFGSLSVTVRNLYVGPEIGYDGRIADEVSIRPYTGFGYFCLIATAEYGGSDASDSEGRFYIAPGMCLNVSMGDRSVLGFDGRYVVVTGEAGGDLGAFGAFLCLGFVL
jgi:hypothetical protein